MNLEDISQSHSFILHINHASLLIKQGPYYVLTDPWIISPAFASWVQNPSPYAQFIEFICNIPPENLAILVSHGHDDHIDDFFLRTHLSMSAIYFSKFRSPGLANRLKKIFNKEPIAIESEWIQWNCFEFLSIVNADFTLNDAINIIRSNELRVVHANDNWHKQPAVVIDELIRIKSEHSELPFYYFSQIGIADCFPNTYPQYSDNEKLTITSSRLAAVIEAATDNAKSLGIHHFYSYANQSRIDNSLGNILIDNYSLTQHHIYQHKNFSLTIDQLNPGDYFLPSVGLQKSKLEVIGKTIFESVLERFEAATNEYLWGCNVNGSVHFAEYIKENEFKFEEKVAYITTRYNWQNILTGIINLEAITIGGIGCIYKSNKQENIRDIHNAISKYAYIAQKNFISSGFDWLK